ncbi:MAG: DUF7467 domain-containing protein [Luteibaculum sp.]
MKKFAYGLLAGLVAISCQKDLDTISSSNRYQLNNESENLEQRLEETIVDVQLENPSSESAALQWMHVAKMELPGEDAGKFQLSDISSSSNLGVVAYASSQNGLKSEIDVLNLADEDLPSVTSSLIIKEFKAEKVLVDDAFIYVAGLAYSKPEIHKIPLVEGTINLDGIVRNYVEVKDFSALSLSGDKLLVASSEGMFAFKTSDLTATEAPKAELEKNKALKFQDLSLHLNDKQSLDIYSKSAKGNTLGSYGNNLTQVNAQPNYLLVANANGSVDFLQVFSSEDYTKCKKKKKDKKNKKDKNKKKGKDKGKGKDKDKGNGSSADIEADFEDCYEVKLESSKDLSNIVIDFAPAGFGSEDKKLDGLSGHKKTLKENKEILGVWVKSGANHSGDCPGCGEYFENDSDCDGSSDNGSGDSNDGENCQCEGKMQSFTVLYTGPNASVSVTDKKGNAFSSFNASNGNVYTVNGYDDRGRMDSKTFLKLNGSAYEIHTSCSEDILGNVYGPFEVIAYTDGEGFACGDPNPDNGGGVGSQTFTECTVKGADPGYAFYQAVWLDDFALVDGVLYDRGYRFEGGSGTFKELPDHGFTK